jgi:hypothetical protein
MVPQNFGVGASQIVQYFDEEDAVIPLTSRRELKKSMRLVFKLHPYLSATKQDPKHAEEEACT